MAEARLNKNPLLIVPSFLTQELERLKGVTNEHQKTSYPELEKLFEKYPEREQKALDTRLHVLERLITSDDAKEAWGILSEKVNHDFMELDGVVEDIYRGIIIALDTLNRDDGAERNSKASTRMSESLRTMAKRLKERDFDTPVIRTLPLEEVEKIKAEIDGYNKRIGALEKELLALEFPETEESKKQLKEDMQQHRYLKEEPIKQLESEPKRKFEQGMWHFPISIAGIDADIRTSDARTFVSMNKGWLPAIPLSELLTHYAYIIEKESQEKAHHSQQEVFLTRLVYKTLNEIFDKPLYNVVALIISAYFDDTEITEETVRGSVRNWDFKKYHEGYRNLKD